jgi:hypothetical protein
LKSVLADDAQPFDLVYVDIQPPKEVAEAIESTCADCGAPFIRHDDWIAPSAARKAALAQVETPYVLFIDNDVLPEPGCIGRLVACAEETGAGVVGPLYVYAAHGRREIHMAGGELVRDGSGRIVSEHHRLMGEPVAAAETLARQPADFVEYHCVLVRTELARRPGVISDDVLLVHEHIDLALAAREAGYEVWTEPSARVELVQLSPPRLLDLAFQQHRWDETACEASLAAFARRWPIADHNAFFGSNRFFRQSRAGLAQPFHRPGGEALDRPMAAGELAQTRTALREQAQARVYAASVIRQLEAACDLATLLMDGAYRADGRPFLNHLIGTASALLRYDFRPEVVLAGLLHAAYTHRPGWMDPAQVTAVIGAGSDVDALIKALPAAKAQLAAGADVDHLTLAEALALAIEAANETDMRLAGEYRATGRAPEISERGMALIGEVLERLGAPGLAAAAASERGDGPGGSVFGQARLHQAFRLDARNRKLSPALSRG